MTVHNLRPTHSAAAILALAAVLAVSLAQAGPAAARNPDRAFATPIVRGHQAQASVTAGELGPALARALRRSGGARGAWVGDPETGATLFSRGASRRLQIASNMKLFTTATALARLGPDEQFETSLIAAGTFANGVVSGNLILRGGGDPSLTRQGIGRLVAEARARGLTAVTGRVLYDETIFDRRRRVQQQGISGGPFAELGRLSGLSFDGGRSADPARSAALSAITALRRSGVSVSKKTARGNAPPAPPPEAVVADVSSAPLSALAKSTNTFSINFYAEMLVKAISADAQGRGTTLGGIGILRSFAAAAGAGLRGVNGSGLSRADRASPAAIGRLLSHMLKEEEPVRDAFLGSLAVAGGTGTLARRMRGTPAQGRCIGKTGTLTGVSALSGYCEVAPDRFIAFSILMNRVNVGRAHVAQDRMTALIASYTP